MGYILDNDFTLDDFAAFEGKRVESNVASLELLEVRDNTLNRSHTSCNSFVGTFEVVSLHGGRPGLRAHGMKTTFPLLNLPMAAEYAEEDSDEDGDQEEELELQELQQQRGNPGGDWRLAPPPRDFRLAPPPHDTANWERWQKGRHGEERGTAGPRELEGGAAGGLEEDQDRSQERARGLANLSQGRAKDKDKAQQSPTPSYSPTGGLGGSSGVLPAPSSYPPSGGILGRVGGSGLSRERAKRTDKYLSEGENAREILSQGRARGNVSREEARCQRAKELDDARQVTLAVARHLREEETSATGGSHRGTGRDEHMGGGMLGQRSYIRPHTHHVSTGHQRGVQQE
jgi:hypothetical protein